MKTNSQKTLFDKVTKKGITFHNAIAMAPMTRARAIENLPNESIANYYRQRASAGLIITEGVSPSNNGLGYARTPGIFSEEQIKEWKKVTSAVHERGSKIFAQLMHVGRIAHSANMPAGGKILAPSAVIADSSIWTDTLGMQKNEQPEAMSLAEIKQTIREFADGARNAIAAGFDGVELHGANGYLLEQFLNPNTNHRTDEYGGSIENRSRFVLEVTEAVANAIGTEKIGIRLSPNNQYNDMKLYDETAATYTYLVNALSKLDVVYLHIVDHAAGASDANNQLIHQFRHTFSNILILNGGYTKARAEKAILEDEADMISFGTSFIANPDLPHRLKNDLPLAAADPNTFFTAGDTGFTDYAPAEINAA